MRLTDLEVDNTIDFTDMNVNIETNQELGNFQYGGSTLVLHHFHWNVGHFKVKKM